MIMENQREPKRPSLTDCRRQLVQTLDKILEREQQWLMELESHAEEVGASLIEYMSDHIRILSDTVVALASGKYKTLSVSVEVSEAVCKDIASYIEFAMALHLRACTNLNKGLVAKGNKTIELKPILLT